MKVSLNLIRHASLTHSTSPDPYTYGAEEIIKRIGYQLGAVESVEYTGKKYEGVVIAKIVSCQKHPNADKLNICMIDDDGVVENIERGTSGFVQVVCGAPNVAAGQLVAWIPPGVIVPSTYGKDEFVLEAREIRGKVSNGMLGSPKELALGDNHDGILVINANDVGDELAQPGVEFSRLYGLNDVIIDCENKMFTHRPDCFGTMGVAREIAGIFGDQFTSPKWYTQPIQHELTAQLPLSSGNEIPDLVPRFLTQAVADVKVTESPMWLQAYLLRIGLRPINNIVDYTNFFMMETGQPLHAFDYDKVAQLCSGEVGVFPRMARAGETLELLNGKTITLTEQDMVIATDTKAVAVAGVIGGSETEVDDSTKNIIIECANFDMFAIRRTSMRHGLFTDAVTRFNKGQSPLQNDRVLAKMVDEIVNSVGGKVASDPIDLTSFDLAVDNLSHVTTSTDFINERLGTHLSASEMKTLLENVEFIVAVDADNSGLLITVPFWRMDIAIAEDIVEEVGRLYGYDRLPVRLPPRSAEPAALNQRRLFQQQIREKLTCVGANEVLNYSFVHGDLMRTSGIDPDQWAYHLRNAISPELQYYRTALVPSLLAKIHPNIKAFAGSDNNQFALFEFGKVHQSGVMEHDEPNLPRQMRRLAFVFAADERAAKSYSGSPYYQAKLYLDFITRNKASYRELTSFDDPMTSVYRTARSAEVFINDVAVGVIGECSQKITKALKLPKFCAAFELDSDLLADLVPDRSYNPLAAFPATSQDITIEVDSGQSWGAVRDFLQAELGVVAAEDSLFYKIEPLDIFKVEEKLRFSYRVTLNHPQKTMTTGEVNVILDHLEQAVIKTFSNSRRV